MRAMGIAGLFAGVVVLADCSERSLTTAPKAPAAAVASAGFIGDRPYTWTLSCSGDLDSFASWTWTAGGAAVSSGSATCSPSSSPSSGAGVRPAAADGLNACVNGDGSGQGQAVGACKTWTFDPAGPFKMQLKGSRVICPDPFSKSNNCPKATGTLYIDS